MEKKLTEHNGHWFYIANIENGNKICVYSTQHFISKINAEKALAEKRLLWWIKKITDTIKNEVVYETFPCSACHWEA